MLIWDSSVLEKPESLASPDLGAVRSSKARRLTRIKPGYYSPPSRPIFVPGWHWLGLLLLGRDGQSGPPEVATMRWWRNRGPHQSDRRAEELELLIQVARRWGRRVCHVWDRGFAGSPWLKEALARHVRFVVRWPGRYRLLGQRTGWQPVNAWQLVRGQRSWDHRLLWDARHHCERRIGVLEEAAAEHAEGCAGCARARHGLVHNRRPDMWPEVGDQRACPPPNAYALPHSLPK